MIKILRMSATRRSADNRQTQNAVAYDAAAVSDVHHIFNKLTAHPVPYRRQGFPTSGLAVGTPWGCQTQIQGVSNSFPGSNTKIRNLVPRSVCRRFEF